MRMLITLLTVLAMTSMAAAQSSKSNCRAMEEPLAEMTVQMGVLLEGVRRTENLNVLTRFRGVERQAMAQLDAARADLEKALEAYVGAAGNAARAMRRCAR
jgi:multidrug efflux pump subunit AcrA (membrane-fusion protein)